MCCSVLQCVVIASNRCCRMPVLQCVVVSCSVLWYVPVCCGVGTNWSVCCSVLQCVPVFCSVLQCVAVCCSVLQCFQVCSSYGVAEISRLLKIKCLFGEYRSLLYGSFAKETYNLKEPTSSSHPIPHGCLRGRVCVSVTFLDCEFMLQCVAVCGSAF